MADSLEGVLARIPGSAGYYAKQRFNQQQDESDLHQASGAMGVLAAIQKARTEQDTKAALSESGGDVEKAMGVLISKGNLHGAHALAPIYKAEQERKMQEESVRAFRELNRGGGPGGGGDESEAPAPAAPQELGAGQPIAVAGEAPPVTAPAIPSPVDPRQARIDKLNKLSEIYARNPVVVQRIQSEIDRLSKQENKTRTYQKGEESITEELQPDGTWKELGRGPKFARQVAPTVSLTSQGDLDPAAIKDLAIQSLYDPNATMGYRRDPKMMAKIANERVKIMRETGVTSEDVVSGRAGFKADTVSLNKMTPQYDAITAFEQTAIRNGKILVELADKVDTTGVPVAERWIRAGRKEVGGDPDVAKFNAQMNLYRAEAARILTQPNLSGVLTDTARKEMEEVIRNSASAKQIREVVGLLERDFGNRKQTLEEQISSIRARMRSRVAPGGEPAGPSAPTPAPAPAPAAAPKQRLKFDAQGNPIQ